MATATETRLLTVTLPGSIDAVLTGFSGGEAMSRLFSYQLEMESTTAIDPTAVVGKNVTWAVQYNEGEPRYFNGFISRLAASSMEIRGFRVYRAEVVPWLWFLTRSSDCRIFQNKTAPDIIKLVFTTLGFAENSDFKLSLKATYPTREYCVQYRETAFNFVSRLMEQEGIFYYFTHDNGTHQMVLADKQTAYVQCVENQIVYSPAKRGPGLVTTWDHQYTYRSGVWTQTDYNFETPKTSLLTTQQTVLTLTKMSNYELFDYPGEYVKTADGSVYTTTRMVEEEVTYEVINGSSGCTTFNTGGTFTMATHEVQAEEGKTYVLTAVQHVATDLSASNSSRRPSYSNSFTCIPSTVAFGPARLTIKPMVQGPQTAVVVGPKGQEIYTDKYGRIKVQFFWDRYGKKDESSSCWMRVAQVWAGKRWGASFWPRIGQEVVVDFLDGDPDRPLITGSVYNADQMPPYQGTGPDSNHASDNKVSGIKTNSTTGGDGYNELRFDDTKGTEQVFIHAQYNMDVRVLNDSKENVLDNKHVIVGGQDQNGNNVGNDYQKVFVDRHIHVLNNHLEHIEGNLKLLVGKGSAQDGGNVDISIEKDTKELIGGALHLHVKKDMAGQVDGKQDLTVVGDKKELLKAASHLHVTGDRNEKVDGKQSLTVGGDQQEKVTGNHALESGQAMYFKAGMTLVLEAGMQLSLKVGGNFIDIGPSGVSIVGTMVMINSGGAAGSGSAPSPTAPTDATAPQDAADAAPTDPTAADDAKTGYKSASS